MKTFKRKPEEDQPKELRPRNAQRADIIPTEGFAMVVDGKLKAGFTDEQVAPGKFPMLRIEVYNEETRVRTKVEAVAS